MTTQPTTRDKVLNACHRLNAEAYECQVLAKKNRIVHFAPCAKAEALMQHVRTGKHFGTCHAEAAYTICPCHNSLTEQQLIDYEYDETYKLANYNHDHKTLYPRLHSKYNKVLA